MSVKLRYTGPIVTGFLNYGELAPGQEFEVADERADAFLAHGHIERIKAAKVKADKADPKTSDAKPTGTALDVTTNS